jgi:broad specificity phosphatase PhoE
MRIYFTRHGESEANRYHIISNRDLPHPLTDTGRRQAVGLAGKLLEKSITRIYASPIPRAWETAQIISRVLGVPVETADALREPDCGVLEGRGDEEAWKQHNYWKESWFQGREQDRGPEGGEAWVDLQKRLIPFIDKLIIQYGETQAELLLVTHGSLILFGLPGVLEDLDHQSIWERGLGHMVLITTELRAGKLVCLAWEPMNI